jgi:hypothetical protein
MRDNLLRLVEGREARKNKGFRISPQTAPPVIEALRLCPRMHVGEPASYKFGAMGLEGLDVEEIVASASLIMIEDAAFHPAVEHFQLKLVRQGEMGFAMIPIVGAMGMGFEFTIATLPPWSTPSRSAWRASAAQ